MRGSVARDLIILIGIFALLWIGFSYLPFFKSTDEEVSMLSFENEEKLGGLIIKAIEKDPNTKLCSNPVLDSAIAQIKFRLIENIGLTEYDYRIRVIEHKEINAFTIPGGNIYIYSGLIDFCKSPEELAAVLAHEIGHAEERHVVSRLAKELGISILFSVLSGNNSVLLSELGQTSLSTVFDREQEKEADNYSFALMEKSKLDPGSMSSFMMRLREKHADAEKVLEKLEWMNTHPNTNSRIKSSMEYKTAPGFTTATFDLDWVRVKRSLKNSAD